MNRRQAVRLSELADHVRKIGRHFMFELLVPMTHEQSDPLDGDQHLYDHDLRRACCAVRPDVSLPSHGQGSGASAALSMIVLPIPTSVLATWQPKRESRSAAKRRTKRHRFCGGSGPAPLTPR
jgi:hypothetical protein